MAKIRKLLVFIIYLAILLLIPKLVVAATYTASVSGDWDQAATWGGVGPPAAFSSDTIIINTGITVNLVANTDTTGSLTLNGTGTLQLQAFTMTAGSLVAAGSAIINNSSTAATLTVGSDNTSSTYTGVISGAITLIKNGTGTLTLTGTNTYIGATTISAGILSVIGSTSTGAVSVTGTLTGTGTVGGAVTVNNGGTIRLGAASGTLTFSNASSPVFTATSTLSILATAAPLDKISLSDATPTFVCGNVALIVDTTGLAGTVSGVTIVQTTNAAGVTGTFSSVSVIGNTGYSAVPTYNAASVTLTLTPAGDRYWSGTGTWDATSVNWGLVSGGPYNVATFSTGSRPIFEGTAGTVTVSSPNAIGNTLEIRANGYVFVGGTITQTADLLMTGSNGMEAEIQSVIAGNYTITKGSYSGKMKYFGANTYTGKTTLLRAIVQVNTLKNLSVASSLGAPTTVANGTINLGGGLSRVTLEYTGTGDTTNRVIELNASGAVGNALWQSGTGLLKFTSDLIVSSGVIGTTPLFLRAVIDGTGELAGVIPDYNTAGGRLTSLEKDGPGTWMLSGANTYTGATTIIEGTLLVNGSTHSSSAVAVNSGGTLGGTGTVNGAITVAGTGIMAPGVATGNSIGTLNTAGVTFTGGTYAVDLDGTTPSCDKINATGTVALGAGVAALTVANCVNSAVGKVYTIVSATSVTGTFSGKANGATFTQSGRNFLITYTSTAVTLTDVPSLNTKVWNGGGGTNSWILNANWVGGVAPSAGDDLVFAGSVQTSPTNDFAADTSFSSITFASGASAFTLAAGARITLTGAITNSSANTQTINSAIIVNVATTIDGSSNIVLGGIISGTGGLIKSGANTLTLSGANTYTGATAVSVGTLVASNNLALGDITGGTTVASGATLDINGYILGAEPITIAGTGVGGNGALINTRAQQPNALRYLSLSADATVGGTHTFNINFVTTQLTTASFTGNGFTLTKVGGNTFAFSGIATNSVGNIIVNGGTFQIAFASTLLGAGGSLTMNNGTSLKLYRNSGISRPVIINGAVNLDSQPSGGGGISGAITLSAGAELTCNSQGVLLTLSGDISGAGSIVKTGPSPLTLTSANTYTGATTISEGALQIGDGGATGSITNSANIVNNAALVYNRTGTFTYGNVISGTGTITKNGSSTLTLSNTNTYTGTTTINAGTLLVTGATHASSAVSVASGATLGGTGTVAGTVDVANGGTLAPGTGGTTIGTLTSGAVTLNATSIYSVNLNGSGSLADRVTSTGVFTCAGTLTLANIINAAPSAVYVIASGPSISGTFSGLAEGATVNQLSRSFTISYLSNQVTLTDVPITRTWDGGGGNDNWTTAANWVGDVAPNAGENLIFAGSVRTSPVNDYSAATSFNSITFDNTASAFTLTNAGAQITLTGSITNNDADVQTINLNIAMAAPRTVNAASGNIALGGIISGAGGLTKTGAQTLTLSNANTFTGTTMISAGTLQLGNGGATGSITNSANIVNNAALVYNRTGTFTYGNVISGTGTITKNGSSTLTLSNTNTYTGTTTINAGTLLVTGATHASSAVSVASGATLGGTGTVAGTVDVANGGTLVPGTGGTTIGTLSSGALTLNGTATYSVDLDGVTPTFDRVTSSGAVACAGTLTVASMTNGAAGKVYTILSGTSVSGTFSGLANNAVLVANSRHLRINYTATTVTLTDVELVITARQTLDVDGDGQIDGIRLTFNYALNDDFGDFEVSVAGYTVSGYVTGTANDAVIDVVINESGSGDTGAVPDVQIITNTTLSENGGAGLVAVEGAATAATDTAAPVLLSSLWTDGDANGVDAGDTITLTFSETVTATGMVIGDIGLPVIGDSLSSTTTPDQTTASILLTLAGTPQLTPGGVYNSGALAVGKPSGIYLVDPSAITDAVGLNPTTGNNASARDITGTNTLAIAWVTGSNPKTWPLGTVNLGITANTTAAVDLAIRNVGDSTADLSVAVSATAPSGWTPAASAGTDTFLVKVDNAGLPAADPTDPTAYELTLSATGQSLIDGLLSGFSTDLELFIGLPTAITVGGGIQQTTTVTITATLPP